MSEWSMVQSWKGCVGAIPPGVRIPSSLPLLWFRDIKKEDKAIHKPCSVLDGHLSLHPVTGMLRNKLRATHRIGKSRIGQIKSYMRCCFG